MLLINTLEGLSGSVRQDEKTLSHLVLHVLERESPTLNCPITFNELPSWTLVHE